MKEIMAVGINNRTEHKQKGTPEIDLVLKGRIVRPPKMKIAEKIQFHVYYAMGAFMETPLENLINFKENNFDEFKDALSMLTERLSNMNIPTEFITELKEDVLYRHCDANLTARLLITTKDLNEVNRLIIEGEKQLCVNNK